MPSNSSLPHRTLYILYNANSTLLGKLHYGYRKLRPSNTHSNPACAACDITHGGLTLSESPKWLESKEEIERAGNLKVMQLHRDEVGGLRGGDGDGGLGAWIKERSIRWPAVVLGRRKDAAGESEGMESGSEIFELVVEKEELISCGGKPEELVKMLRGKGVLGGIASL